MIWLRKQIAEGAHEYFNMKEVLLIMQPREIPEAISSFKALDISKVWFRAFTEEEAVERMNSYVERSDFDYYYIGCDDCVADQEALDSIRTWMDGDVPIATGWCLVSQEKDLVNLTRNPVVYSNGIYARVEDYDFLSIGEIRGMPHVFDTYFAGFALTAIRRDIWMRYPLKVNEHTRQQTDVEFSNRVLGAGVPIMAVRNACVHHLKQQHDVSLKLNWIVGEREPEVEEEL